MGVIQPEQALHHHGAPSWRFVDCRFDLMAVEAGRSAWADSTIAGAAHADLERDLCASVGPSTGRHPLPEPMEAARRLAGIGLSNEDTIVAFDDRGGPFAARLWWMLRWLGHDASRVHVLDGGLSAWTGPRAAGSSLRAGSYAPKPKPELVVSADELGGRGPHVVVVDARTAARFRGEHEPIDPVAGHVPGAVNLPWPNNLVDGRFAPKASLRSRAEDALGSTDASSCIVYCGSGVTACHDLLAMEHAGLGLGRLYAGSWSEWIRPPIDEGPARAIATGP